MSQRWAGRGRAAILLLALATLRLVAPAAAAGADGPEPGLLCRMAIRQAETGRTLPAGLLTGIARVESGRRDPGTGRLHPWPWTINAEGRGYYFEGKAEAIAFARGLQARGVRSFDVGCLQINMMHHATAFPNLEEAFDPVVNARYAAKFLNDLRDKTGSWDTASAWYHSANPELGTPYRNQVAAAMADEAKSGGQYASLPTLAPGAGGGGGVASPVRSLPSGPGTVILLAGGSGGMVLPHPAATFTTVSMTSSAMGGGMAGGPVGRGLEAYRMQPVAIVGPRMIASR